MKAPTNDEVKQVSLSAGFGFRAVPGVRNWMMHKGYGTYAEYARGECPKPQAQIQREIEAFVFG